MSPGQIYSEITRDRPKEHLDAVRQFELLQLVILCFIDDALEYIENSRLYSRPCLSICCPMLSG
ncbi:hypothetical protein BDV06DRAFT_201020 [Aspergillus oleicola]